MQTKKPNLRDKIKHFIEEYYGQYGTSPTIRCIAENVGCSKSNVPIYIEDLKEQAETDFLQFILQLFRTTKPRKSHPKGWLFAWLSHKGHVGFK